MLVKFRNLVKVFSLDEGDNFIKWVKHLGVYDFELECRLKAAKMFLPVDQEFRIKDQLELPLCKSSLKLFSYMLTSDVGLELKKLGFTNGEWKSPDTCVGQLTSLYLARVQDECRFKALPPAFDPRIQYLIGARTSPN